MASPLIGKLGRAERALSMHNIAHQIDQIRSKIDEVIQGLSNLNSNVAASPGSTPIIPYGLLPVGLTANSVLAGGVSNDVSRTDHVHSIASAAPSGYFGTNYSIGVANGLIRSDAVLKYPDSLGVNATPITDLLVLSDDATEGALLTASNTYAVNSLALKAPNATNTLRIGKYGNMSLAGSALVDTTLLVFSKSYDETAALPTAINASITNTNTGSAIAALGINCTVSASMTTAAAFSTNPAQGMTLSVTGGAGTNNNFRGPVSGYRSSVNATSQTAGTATVASMDAFITSGMTITRSAVTDTANFHAKTVSLLFSGTTTNLYGLLCDALTSGTNRYGVRVLGTTTGTPTLAIGLDVASHTVGTDRWGVRTANKIENTATDFIASTAAKGYICKDAAGTPHYWRYTVAADGTPAIVDTGTTLPTA